MELLHKTNIIIHVITGSIALIVGIIALIVNKWSPIHKRIGRLFLWLMSIVVFTGFLGVFVFGQNSFLVIITALSAYSAYSGYRILQIKSNKLYILDISIGILTISTVLYFLYYLKKIGMFWSPIVIYSTIGATVLIVSYDILRYLIPKNKYGKLWLYEHIYKMIAAFTALLAAFSGTVFEKYQPFSQIAPSVLGTILSIGFIVFFYRMFNQKNT